MQAISDRAVTMVGADDGSMDIMYMECFMLISIDGWMAIHKLTYTNRLGLTVQLQYTHILQNYHFSLTLNFL